MAVSLLEGFDPATVGEKVKDYCDNTLNKAGADITTSGLDCAHIPFSELTKDPIAMMKSVYKQFDWNFSAEYESILREYLIADEKKRQIQFAKAKESAVKIHDPEVFHLNKEYITNQFSAYINQYGLQSTK